jgi:hypothetical protein
VKLDYGNLPAGTYTIQCYANQTLGGTTPYDHWTGYLSGTGSLQLCGKAGWQPNSGWYELRLSGPYSATVHQNV